MLPMHIKVEAMFEEAAFISGVVEPSEEEDVDDDMDEDEEADDSDWLILWFCSS